MRKYKVNLEARINPDFLEPHELMAVNLNQPTIQYSTKHDTLADCSMTCRMFIRSHNLGGGSWAGGQITDRDGNFVGRVSYNGRVWDENENEITELM